MSTEYGEWWNYQDFGLTKHTHSKIAALVKKKPITHTKREKKQNKKIANANENKEKKDAL